MSASSNQKMILAKSSAQAVLAAVECVKVIANGREYRANLAALVQGLQTDQSIRHQDVELMIQILDNHRQDMSQKVRDEYYLAMLEILKKSGLKQSLPSPS